MRPFLSLHFSHFCRPTDSASLWRTKMVGAAVWVRGGASAGCRARPGNVIAGSGVAEAEVPMCVSVEGGEISRFSPNFCGRPIGKYGPGWSAAPALHGGVCGGEACRLDAERAAGHGTCPALSR